jgi:site-specific recombinase XerD
MSDLEVALASYLAVRRSVGYKLVSDEYLLRGFVAFCAARGAATVTTQLAVTWATAPQAASRAWWGQRLSAVRGFATYLSAFDDTTQVPEKAWLPNTTRRIKPHLYSAAEVAAVMAAAGDLAPPLRGQTMATIVGLLAATGMRIGEVLGLDTDSIDVDNSLVRISHAKLDAARDVPLSRSTITALASFIAVRDRHVPAASQPSLFVSATGRRLSYKSVQATFKSLLVTAGITAAPGRRPPRLHDLRHSFAVSTLCDFYASGNDVAPMLPRLSTYLGHVDPSSTYWYLEATPELLEAAARLLECHVGGQR